MAGTRGTLEEVKKICTQFQSTPLKIPKLTSILENRRKHADRGYEPRMTVMVLVL